MSQTQEYKLISWNVNGLRAVLKKEPSFTEIFETINADVFALQETKLQEGQVELDLPGYVQTWNYADRKGYSGTAVFSRETPLQVIRQIGCPVADDEGRVCALEFEKFWFVCVYTPNSKDQLARLDERLEWDQHYREFLAELSEKKPVIITLLTTRLTLRTLHLTGKTQDFRMRNARALPSCWTQALPIHLGIAIPT